MAATEKSVRQSVSLPAPIARRVRTIARKQHVSASRVLVALIQSGLQAQERERERFMELAERLASVSDPAEQARIKEELARMTFGA